MRALRPSSKDEDPWLRYHLLHPAGAVPRNKHKGPGLLLRRHLRHLGVLNGQHRGGADDRHQEGLRGVPPRFPCVALQRERHINGSAIATFMQDKGIVVSEPTLDNHKEGLRDESPDGDDRIDWVDLDEVNFNTFNAEDYDFSVEDDSPSYFWDDFEEKIEWSGEDYCHYDKNDEPLARHGSDSESWESEEMAEETAEDISSSEEDETSSGTDKAISNCGEYNSNGSNLAS